MAKLELDYYYGRESEQFTFYRLPKALITDSRFKTVSNNAKLLYGLMLDRMSLSRRRGWLDDENRVYIKYSNSSIAEDLNIAKNTCTSLMRELEAIGLIDIVQENGKANIIYVKNFIVNETSANFETVEDEPVKASNVYMDTYDDVCDNEEKNEGFELHRPSLNLNQRKNCAGSEIAPVQKFDQFNNCEGTYASLEMVPAQNLTPNNNISNNNLRENNLIHLSADSSCTNRVDSMDQVEAYMEIVKENIDYNTMMSDTKWTDRGLYDELYNIICDVVCVPRETIRIGGEDYPYSLVKSKFLKLTSSHLNYVIMCMRNNTTKVNNIKAYLITALYNAPNTIDHYYASAVNHDMYGVG